MKLVSHFRCLNNDVSAYGYPDGVQLLITKEENVIWIRRKIDDDKREGLKKEIKKKMKIYRKIFNENTQSV